MESGSDIVRAEGAVGNRLLPVSREREGSARRERKVARDEVVLEREAAREEVCGCGVSWFQRVVSRERRRKRIGPQICWPNRDIVIGRKNLLDQQK
jgi:hypothetical protein